MKSSVTNIIREVFVGKKYTIPQKIMLGLITLIFVGIPIVFWMWVGYYLY